MGTYIVVVHEEIHLSIDAESEQEIRDKFEQGGSLLDQGGETFEIDDRIVTITEEV